MAIVIASATALSTTTGAVSAEQVSGTYQFVGKGRVTLVCRGSATGMNATLLVGGIALVNDQPIPFTGTAGAISVADHTMCSSVMPGGKVELKFRNTTGGTLTTDYILYFD